MKWEPDNFELEKSSVWSFPERGNWATHDSKYRGNCSPYVFRNLILRYSEEGEWILDPFVGGGTSLVEAKLLNRNIVGTDINPSALERCKNKTDFECHGGKSNRTIKMPKFLCEEMQDYIRMLYDIDENERIFQITKSYLHHEMDRGAKAAGVKRIRIHDLRHSHISLLIEMGFSALAIADRVGHESIDITYRYAHLFPNKQTEMANRLDVERITDIVLTGNIEEEISVDQIKKDAEDAKEDAGYKG